MENYIELAAALSDFLGQQITAEDILSFDFKIEDSKTDFVFESSLSLTDGKFTVYVSEYVATLKHHTLKADSSEELAPYVSDFTSAIRNLHSGLNRLDELNKIITREGAELAIDVTIDKVTSTYRASLGGNTFFTRDPSEMADTLDTYIKRCKTSRVELLNDRLATYTSKRVVFGENYEWYQDGLFLSIYFRTKTNFVITFHPGINVDQWVRYECSSMKGFNEAVDKILRRLS